MKAMILAAGKGTRLHPITMNTPKPLIPLVDRPVIDLLLENFSSQGIREFAINLGHLGEEIQQNCQSGSAYGADILYSWEGQMTKDGFQPEPVGSAASIKKIQEDYQFFDGTFVVVCGDAYIDIDIWDAVRFHHSKGSMATVITRDVPIEEVEKYGVVLSDEEGRIISFQEKPSQKEALSTQINTGIYIFEPEVIDLIPAGEHYDIGADLFPALVKHDMPFYSIQQEFNWLDIGNFKDIFATTGALLRGEINGFNIPGKKASPKIYLSAGAQIDSQRVLHTGINYLGSASVVEEGASLLGENVVGRNCVIRDGALLENCVVMGNNLEFLAGCELRNCIVTNDFVISSSGSYLGLWESRHIRDVRYTPGTSFLPQGDQLDNRIVAI